MITELCSVVHQQQNKGARCVLRMAFYFILGCGSHFTLLKKGSAKKGSCHEVLCDIKMCIRVRDLCVCGGSSTLLFSGFCFVFV